MLEYNKIDISEGIDINKTSLSKECDICHYFYFKDIGFKFTIFILKILVLSMNLIFAMVVMI